MISRSHILLYYQLLKVPVPQIVTQSDGDVPDGFDVPSIVEDKWIVFNINKNVLNESMDYFKSKGNLDDQHYVDVLLNSGDGIRNTVRFPLIENALTRLKSMVHSDQYGLVDEMCRLYIDEEMTLDRLLSHETKTRY